MLMMRRHEKDFLARLDAKYGVELKARAGEFTTALAGTLPVFLKDHSDFSRFSGESASWF
jgi:methyl-accepting chemotaxis protein